MKRDDDCIRQLLIEFEAEPNWLVLVAGHSSLSEEQKKRQYHVFLLCDAGLMVAINASAFRMTSQGHDYLDAIRDNGIWCMTKQVVAETGGSASLDIIKSLSIGFLKTKIAKHTGIAL